MTWVKLDDQFFAHPKTIKAGRDARDLFIAGLCHCASQLTDGFVGAEIIPLIAFKAGVSNAKKAVAALLSVGFWETTEGGYLVHDYLEYNPSADRVKADRMAARGRMNRRRRPDSQPDASQDSLDFPQNFGECSPEQNAKFAECSPSPVPDPFPYPYPTRIPTDTYTSTDSTDSGGVGGDVRPAIPPPGPVAGQSVSQSDGKKAEGGGEETRLTPAQCQAIVAKALALHPHWGSALDALEAKRQPTSPPWWRVQVIRNWETGDGTPPEPQPTPSPKRSKANSEPRENASAYQPFSTPKHPDEPTPGKTTRDASEGHVASGFDMSALATMNPFDR
jgi:hypothetical protein